VRKREKTMRDQVFGWNSPEVVVGGENPIGEVNEWGVASRRNRRPGKGRTSRGRSRKKTLSSGEGGFAGNGKLLHRSVGP